MEKINKLLSYFESLNIQKETVSVYKNEPMSRHTTFRIGGNALVYAEPEDEESLEKIMKSIREENVKYFLLGNGSNVLFADEGFDGVVVSMSGLKNVTVNGNEITAEAGASLASVCKAARDAELTGLEFAYGIPGSVGGAVFMNAGAYGGEISGVLKTSTYLDSEFRKHTITNEEHKFGYRESIYVGTDKIITSAVFSLTPGKREDITAAMNDFTERRVSKQPLEYPSAGSVFKRCAGHFTGQMIEESGLKGYTIGGAQISEKHAGFIINRGNASARDVLSLIDYIKTVIKKNYDVDLECEVIYVH